MKRSLAGSRKALILGFACAVFVLLAQDSARADCVVTLGGTTLGTFYRGDVAINPTLLGIQFQGTNFSTTLVNAGATSAINLGGLNLNLGGLLGGVLGSGLNVGDTLQLLTNVNVNGTALQPLTLVGTLGIGVNGAPTINFAPITSNFVNAAGNVCGSFTIALDSLNLLDPIALLNGLHGNVTLDACGSCAAATPTPEPATMLLLGTGLAGVAASLRKRRRLTAADYPGDFAG